MAYALLLLAAYLPRQWLGAPARSRQRRPAPPRTTVRRRRVVFRILRAHRADIQDAEAPRAPAPAQFVNAHRDQLHTVQRHIAALRHALAEPMPLVRRLARRLRDCLVILPWRPPRRPRDRTHWGELVSTWQEAHWTLGRVRRGELDTS